ncbi:Sugar phosphate permease OS=Ureibacillus acetophenoni OX=614649 GN=SAMN05877842_106130 PE=4 SV=1 [Ureibacillus acetophenoni]
MNKQESGYRWIVYGSALLAYFLIVTQRTAPGLITDQLMKDFQVTGAVIGVISSISFVAYAGLQIPSGLLSDRFGPNRFLIMGTLLTGVGSILYSTAESEYVLMISRFFVGTGDAAIFINLILILTQWFNGKEFIKLLGLLSLVSSVASLTATVPFSLWISYAGWRIPFLSIGIMLVIMTGVLYFVLVWNPKRIFKEVKEDKTDFVQERESVWKILRRLIATRQAWATFLCHFGLVGGYIGFIGSWGVPYAMQMFDMTRAEASQLIMYGLMGAMIGGVFISSITSRMKSIKKVYSIVHLTVVLSWVGMFLSGVNPSFWLVLFLFIAIGFGNGASSLTFAIVRESFSVKEVGVVTGFANMGGFTSAVLLPIIFGSVLDLFPQSAINLGFHYGFIIPIVFSLMGFIGALLVKERKVEQAI